MNDYEECRTAFRDACTCGQVKIICAIQASISKPKNILFLYDSVSSRHEWDTVFHLVCKHKQINCLLLLLMKIQTIRDVPLDLVEQKQTAAVIEDLLLRKDSEGRTALDVCIADQNEPFLKLFDYFYPNIQKYQVLSAKRHDEIVSSWISYLDQRFEKFPYYSFLTSTGLGVIFGLVYLFYEHEADSAPSYSNIAFHMVNFLFQSPMWYFTYKVFTTNPGYYATPPTYTASYQILLDSLCQQLNNGHYAKDQLFSCCHICRLQRSARAGHSKVANKCVEEYDHFCYFLWCDIGKYNYPYFMYYLFAIACFTGPSMLYFGARFLRSYDANIPEVVILMCKIFLAWTLLMWLMVLYLFMYHIYIARKGLTTREYKLQLKQKKL